ncbi:TPA: hypothetical protein ACPJ10_001690 [Vibrio diabolicus]
MSYQNWTPECGYPIPSTIPSKQKINWYCDICKKPTFKSYDNIKASATRSQPCSGCSTAIEYRDVFNALPLRFLIESWIFNSEHFLASDERRSNEAMVFQFRCSKHPTNVWEGGFNKVKRVVLSKNISDASSISCLKCQKEADEAKLEQLKSEKNSSKIVKLINRLWGGNAEYLGKEKLVKNNTSPSQDCFYVSIPKLCLDEDESVVVQEVFLGKGRWRGELTDKVTERSLYFEIKKELKDRRDIKRCIRKARRFGAEVLKVKSVKGTKFYRYRKVTGTISSWSSEWRCDEVCWGRTGLKQGQSFLLAYLQLAFPCVKDWYEDTREILGKRKELDLGTRELLEEKGGLWVEYQGHQSHTECPSTQLVDQWKVDTAPGVLLVIDKMQRYSGDLVIKLMTEQMKGKCPELLNCALIVEPTELEKRAEELIVAKGGAVGEKLRSCLEKANPRHVLLTPETSIISAGVFDYKCGVCEELSYKVSVKSAIDKTPFGCRQCRCNRQLRKKIKLELSCLGI